MHLTSFSCRPQAYQCSLYSCHVAHFSHSLVSLHSLRVSAHYSYRALCFPPQSFTRLHAYVSTHQGSVVAGARHHLDLFTSRTRRRHGQDGFQHPPECHMGRGTFSTYRPSGRPSNNRREFAESLRSGSSSHIFAGRGITAYGRRAITRMQHRSCCNYLSSDYRSKAVSE